MKLSSLRSLLLLTLLLGVESATAQTDTGALVTLLGDDTLAVEQIRYVPGGVEATVVLRTPRTTVTDYRLTLDAEGSVAHYDATTRLPGVETPLRQETFTRDGDSLRVRVAEDGQARETALAAGQTALPFIDMVHWPFDLMLTRAQKAGPGRHDQPLFTNRNVLAFTVAHGTDGQMIVTHPHRGSMTATVDAGGRLATLDAGETTRKLTVTRVPSVDVDALAQRFAARDAAGRPFGPLSGRGETKAEVDGAQITVDYGQPVRRGRDLFGALVPWGERWRTGANRATHFETSRDLVLGGLEVPAGTYTLYSIPEPEGGVLIVNKQTGQTGTSYDPEQDLGRVPMTVSRLPESVELFTIAVDDTPEGGMLRLLWGETALSVPFTVAE